MTLIRRTSPFGDLLTLRQAMDRLFEESYVRPGTWWRSDTQGVLPLDVIATKEALVVKAAVPGIRPEDVDITITGDNLSITATHNEERKEEEGGYLFQELRRGTWSRTVSLPGDLETEAASAAYENGVLTLTIPKSARAKPRQIRLTVGEGAKPAVTAKAGEPASAR